ncbi:MAG: GNAT family N-acetyltransferase [Thermomicrobiales bacterium]|nr:GNAT family N-acetyltransferase [Thermomicrobiales bacterium]MCO5221752.1 GNAT family N-acetyltransferase [Thermomicrobiales bacterium]
MTELTQTYLVGPNIHLRAVEETDAASEPSWRDSWFPRTRMVSEAKIEDEHSGDDTTLLAVRNSDDVVVGSVTIEPEDAWVFVSPFAARWLTDDQAEAVMAEIVTVVLPFLVDEGGNMAALVEVPAGLPLLEAALAGIGARSCYRQRGAIIYRGNRHDRTGWQYFNQKALDVFGAPALTPEGPVERKVASPAPRKWPVVTTPPTGAVIVGERVYLRMFTPDDGEVLRDASLTDTEFLHDPRFPRSAMVMNAHFRKSSEDEPPVNPTFAIVLRENDELIGWNELDDIDLVHRSAETGTELFRPEHRGKGYGTEAKHLLLNYAFDVLNLHMVWSIVWQENPRSRAALLKQGYREAGCIPWGGIHHGLPSGDWMFDLLAEEWQAARR